VISSRPPAGNASRWAAQNKDIGSLSNCVSPSGLKYAPAVKQSFKAVKQENVMNSKISTWLWGDDKDEDFWSAIKDERERKLWLHQLYQSRASLRWGLLLILVGLLIEIGVKSTALLALFVLLLLLLGMSYISTESKIRILRLYELLSLADKKL
jgi:hypothetical protein